MPTATTSSVDRTIAGRRCRRQRPLIPFDVIRESYRPIADGYVIDREGRVASDKKSGQRGYPEGWYHIAVYADKDGRRYVSLWVDGAQSRPTIARLLLETWVAPPPGDAYQAVFKDGDPRNYALDNLCWRSHAELMTELIRDGRHVTDGARIAAGLKAAKERRRTTRSSGDS